MKALRDYQRQAVEKVKAAHERGQHSGIVHFATGLGKTITAFGLYSALVDPRQSRCLFIAPARNLIFQTAREAQRNLPQLQGSVVHADNIVKGIGIVMGSINDSNAAFLVGSAQTLIDRDLTDKDDIKKSDIHVVRQKGTHFAIKKSPQSQRRVLVSERMDEVMLHGVPEYVLFDEAHHAVADNSFILIQRLRQVRQVLGMTPLKLVGFTATPVRNDGRGLINLFETVYDRKDFRWGQRNGYLVPFATPIRVRTQSTSQITTVSKVANWREEVFKAYQELAADRYCMGFTGTIGSLSGVEVSKELTRYFQQMGVSCAHTDGQGCILPNGSEGTEKDRGDIYEQFMAGNIRVLWSFGVGLEGLDLPRADALLWLRNTSNAVLRTQAIGRVLRPFPNKKDALIIDFTSSDLEVEPIGTLMGFRVDPLRETYVAEPDPEEDDSTLSVGRFKQDPLMVGSQQHYNAAKIISRQSNDWYESDDGFLTLSISKADGFVVCPPDMGKMESTSVFLRDIERVVCGEDNPYSDLNPLHRAFYERIQQMPQENVQKVAEFVEWLSLFYGNYTLWHMRVSGKTATPVQKGFVLYNHDLQDLFLEAVDYIQTEIADAASVFFKRNQRWKKDRLATGDQLALLSAMGLPNNSSLTAGEASSMISNVILTKPMRALLATIESQMQKLASR